MRRFLATGLCAFASFLVLAQAWGQNDPARPPGQLAPDDARAVQPSPAPPPARRAETTTPPTDSATEPQTDNPVTPRPDPARPPSNQPAPAPASPPVPAPVPSSPAAPPPVSRPVPATGNPAVAAPAPPLPPLPSPFVVPPGLSMPSERLFSMLGYIPGYCVALTPETAFDIGHACYIRGLYSDAVIFAQHGTTMRNDARLQLLKGVCLLHLGDCARAEATVTDYRAAVRMDQLYGLAVARERVNDPMRVRFEQVVDYQSRIIR